MTSSTLKQRHEAVEALPPLKEVIAAHGLSAQKALGQNFLLDRNITDKIVREAIVHDSDAWEGVHAIEIGPGPGGLTRSLLLSPAADVHAVELDTRAVGALQGTCDAAGGDLTILQHDAMRVDLAALVPAPRVIVANLPYNIATPLLVGWLKQTRAERSTYQSMSLMFQQEVAQRITAQENTKAYGRLAVISQWLCDVRIMYNLPPSAFTPPPKVNSSVVFFKPKALAGDAPKFDMVEKVTAAAFNQRRKMIRQSLKAYMPAIEALGIDPQKRAENLSVSDYLAIASF